MSNGKMLSFHVKFVQTQMDGWTDRRTENGKTICPPSFNTGIKNLNEVLSMSLCHQFLKRTTQGTFLQSLV